MTDPVAGALAACADRLGEDATRVLSRLADTSIGQAARAAHAELIALPPPARRRRRAELAALGRTPRPGWLRLVHPTWIEAALVALPARAREAIASGDGALTPADVWLARWVTALLPPLPAGPSESELAKRIASDPARLVTWLEGIGADQLAFALGPAAAASHHAWLAHASARIREAPRAGQLGPQRAAIARCRGVSLEDAQTSLLIVAGRALAPHLVHEPLARWQLTRRLPHALGSIVDRELLACAHVALDQCPTWAALLAR